MLTRADVESALPGEPPWIRRNVDPYRQLCDDQGS
jgi:hypothetical protein